MVNPCYYLIIILKEQFKILRNLMKPLNNTKLILVTLAWRPRMFNKIHSPCIRLKKNMFYYNNVSKIKLFEEAVLFVHRINRNLYLLFWACLMIKYLFLLFSFKRKILNNWFKIICAYFIAHNQSFVSVFKNFNIINLEIYLEICKLVYQGMLFIWKIKFQFWNGLSNYSNVFKTDKASHIKCHRAIFIRTLKIKVTSVS